MFRYGADYYPEHWPEERWPVDARLMQEAHINTVRLAEFAWSRLEPSDGNYDFAWLDRAIEVLHDHGIDVVLGTPTASPPPWLAQSHPEIYRVDEQGRRLTYGNRREYCPHSPTYREFARRITLAMAEHYADHPAVIGWQIDNEFGDPCYCELSRQEFQVWLQHQYGSLHNLNTAWGTIFWSHVYTEWSQIPLPVATGGVPNPGLELDFKRFSSASYVGFQQEQIDILRAVCPKQFITHNFMGFTYDRIDYYDLARNLDFVSWDNYPRGFWREGVDLPAVALGHDTMRSLKRQSFWVMEEQAGHAGWTTMTPAPRPGEIRLWSWQAVAHGADAIVYFRWRTSRFGTEQYWHGILEHHGQPTRRYAEVQQTGEEFARLGDLLTGAETRAQVAMLMDYDTRFAFQGQPNQAEFSYPAYFLSWYKALHRFNVGVDIVKPGTNLSGYKLLIAPAPYILTPDLASSLENYVRNGGTLVTTFRAGVKDYFNAVVERPLPGLLAGTLGIVVEEYDPQPVGQGNHIIFSHRELSRLASSAPVRVWCDVIEPRGAEVLATYGEGYYAGRAAITLNRVGAGRAVYVGALGDTELHEPLVAWLLAASGVEPVLETPPGVEATVRWQGGRRLLFVLNLNAEATTVGLPATHDLISGRDLAGDILLPGYGVLLLSEG